MRRTATGSIVVCLAVMCQACQPRAFNSAIQHAPDRPLAEMPGDHWMKVPDEQFEAAVKEHLVGILALSFGHYEEHKAKVKFAPPGDATTRWLQAVIDHLDQSLRRHAEVVDQRTGSALSARLQNIPRPRALVQIVSNPNAMAMAASQGSRQVVFPAIVFHAGLIREARSEGDIVAVLAHELAHYYRADPVLPADQKEGFFYRQSEVPVATRPQPDPALAELGRRVHEASRQGVHPLLPGQTLHVGIAWNALSNVDYPLGKLCRTASCRPECQEFLRLADTKYTIFNEDNWDRKDEKFVTLMRPFEESFLACARTVRLADTELDPFLDLPGQDLKPFVQPPYGETLQDLFLVFSKAAAKAEEINIKPLLLQAVKERLGHYTYEEEADSLGLELASIAGFDPRILIDYRLGRLQATGPFWKDEDIEFGYETCVRLYGQKWRDDAGKPVFVPIGDFSEIHHSQCFRAFNLDREIQAHGYPAPDKPPAYPAIPFSEARASAKALLRANPEL